MAPETETNLDKIDINPERIAHLLQDGYWKVPRYQRGYKWTTKHVSDLLGDLTQAIAEKQREYFLGSIVASRGDGERPEIVDGQQRLATVSIIIAGVRDMFIQLTDEVAAAGIESDFLFKTDRRSKQINLRLKLSDSDHNFFETKIIARPSPARDLIAPTRDSHKRILEAQEVVRDELVKIIAMSTPDDRLHELVDYLDKQTLVILVKVPDHQNAFIIFETLNDRGLPLAIADLLKNFLFLRSKSRITEVQERWIEMLTIIETSVSEEAITDFLRHQWSSTYGLTRENKLFRSIKEHIRTEKNAVDYSNQLRLEADRFAAIHNSSHEFWNAYTTPDKEHMKMITGVLGMERITPLLLAILAKFPKKQISSSLKSVVCWGVRLLVAGGVAGALETTYSAAAVEIRKNTIQTTKQLFDFMKGVIPNDSDFEKAFAEVRVSKSSLARYFLAALEKKKLGQKDPELVPNVNETEVNLEHILPQNRQLGSWSDFDDDDHTSYRFRLGNLALMRVSENGAIGNEEFSIKKPRYAQSTLKFTKMLAKSPKWTKSTIDKRQLEMSALALLVWPAKPA